MIIDIILDRREGAINYVPAEDIFRGTGDGTRLSSPYDNQALMIVSYNSKNNLTR